MDCQPRGVLYSKGRDKVPRGGGPDHAALCTQVSGSRRDGDIGEMGGEGVRPERLTLWIARPKPRMPRRHSTRTSELTTMAPGTGSSCTPF